MEEDEPSISFQNEDIDFELPNSGQLSRWIEAVIEREGNNLHEVSYIFCSDEYLFGLNQEYLNHDTYTDIITFPYSSPPQIEGDLFISIDRVRENALEFEVPFHHELLRVMIHGVLHLCGYGDKSPDEVRAMRAKEEEKLRLILSA